MKRRLIVTLLYLMLSTIFISDTVRPSLAQGASPPRNVRITREGDTLRAIWSPPSDGNVNLYFFRWRQKPSDDTVWGGWSAYADTTSTSVRFGNLSAIPDDETADFQVEVETSFGSISSPVTATLWRVSKNPPPRSGGKGSKSRSSKSSYVPKPTLLPPKTCELLSTALNGISITSPYGLGVGIQCQQLDGAGVGIPSIVEAGIIDAVDVWGNVRQARVCFSHDSGSLVFLDAATSPRSILSLESERVDGLICASIDRPGSLVLLSEPGLQDTVATESVAVTDLSLDLSNSEITTLRNCQIRTNYILNLRDAPEGNTVLAWVPYLETMTATARLSDWFRVAWRGIDGWLYARMVSASGVCS